MNPEAAQKPEDAGESQKTLLSINTGTHEPLLLVATLYEELSGLAAAHAGEIRRRILLEQALFITTQKKAELQNGDGD